MKRLNLILLFISLCTSGVFSQAEADQEPRTIFKKGIIGIYAGPYFRNTRIDGYPTDISGGGGGIYIKNRFFITGSSFGQWNPGKSSTFEDKLIKLSMNGVTIGVNSNPDHILHFNAEMFWGAGKAILAESSTKEETGSMNLTFLAPMLDMEVNVYNGFRFFIGFDYRFAMSQKTIAGLPAERFSGPSVFWGIKTGSF